VYGSIEEGYARVARGECFCAMGYSLDVGLLTNDLVVLEDDLSFFQASNLAVGVRTPIVEALPTLEEDLGRLCASLTPEAMTTMLGEVAVNGEEPEVVARRFLDTHDLRRR